MESTLPRVTLPGTDAEARDALEAERAWKTRNRFLFSLFFAQTGRRPYANSVPAHVKAKRRAANKVARASRKANR